MSAGPLLEFDDDGGAHDTAGEGDDTGSELDFAPGSLLRNLTSSWEDVQRTRLALEQRGIPSKMKAEEDRLARQIKREIERHPLWPWLSQYPGLGGVHTARLVALIGDPHRFPGRVCDAGHHHSAAEVSRESDARAGCGYEQADGTVCAAPIGPVRRGTGVRSLWHYLGLHVVDGRSPRRHKGQKADWNPAGRTAVLMPGGIADQIVRSRVPRYRDVYDTTKERLTRERAVRDPESGMPSGLLPIHPAEAVRRTENETVSGLRPFQIDAIARKVAAKAFVGDLLTEWKRVV